MQEDEKTRKINPFTTGLLAFFILHAANHLSRVTQTDLAVSDFFLPSAFSLILVYWVGPRIILPVVFLNSAASSYFWGNPIEDWPYYFFYAIPETLFTFLTWALFIKLFQGKFWFPDTRNTVLFIVVGVLLPSVCSAFLIQTELVITGNLSPKLLGSYVASNILGDFFNAFFIIFPILYFATPWLKTTGFLPHIPQKIPPIVPPTRATMLEMLVIFTALFSLAFLLVFREYWFIYGVFPLYVAIRFGFGPTIVTNMYILLIIYVLPRFFGNFGQNSLSDYEDVINVFLGACLLFVFATITGRVINDLKFTEKKLKRQYSELKKTNQELNQFVYRVSHDLSAPLKSIRGLTHLGRLSRHPDDHLELIHRVEMSVSRLEEFISEILDYFSNKRQRVNVGKINIRLLCEEIMKAGPLLWGSKPVKVYYNLLHENIYQDKIRLKIILKNILYNAIKYQKSSPDHQPFIMISSKEKGGTIQIEIADNGSGIKPEQLDSIFKMFYRGHIQSTGAGLGLYIAKEAVARLKGTISASSTYGEGTKIIINLENRDPAPTTMYSSAS